MKRIAFILLIFSFAFSFTNAQVIPTDQLTKTITPVFLVEDVVFVVQTLKTIEIVGNEVDSFLEVKKLMESEIKKAQQENKNLTDSIKVEVSLKVAQDMVNFLQRAKLSGINADKFKRFIEAVIKSARELNQNQPR